MKKTSQKKPGIPELQRSYQLISETKMSDGNWKQVLQTLRGKIVRVLDPSKTKVINQTSITMGNKKNYKKVISEKADKRK